MLIVIESVLSKQEVQQFRSRLDQADWENGAKSAGSLANTVKFNEQLDESSELAIALGNRILKILGQHPRFISAALPQRIYPPRFNRYSGGGQYGIHVDSAVMKMPGTPDVLRTDLSMTLFLCEPDEYEGGELIIEGKFGAQEVKLAAGDMVLYPSSSLHQVLPVAKGARVCSFFWLQSMVRDDGQRELLFDLDQSIQALTLDVGRENPEVVRLSGIYHNLLRRWAEV